MTIGFLWITAEELAGLTTYYPGKVNRSSPGKVESSLIYSGSGEAHCKSAYHFNDAGIVALSKNGSYEDVIYIGNIPNLRKFREALVNRARYRKMELPGNFDDFDAKMKSKKIQELSQDDLKKFVAEFLEWQERMYVDRALRYLTKK